MAPSEIRVETFQSEALAGNALGDPIERRVHIYLPPGYAASHERLPVVYLLAGFTGTGASFLDFRAWDETIQEMADRLLAEGRIRPMMLILPDGMTRFGGSQYINSEGTGRYQDYLLELVEWTDHRFRTQAEPRGRAIAGKSSGGFGAVRMAMDRPGIFGLIGDVSGDKYFEYVYRPTLPRVHRTLERFPELDSALAHPQRYRPQDQAFRDVMELAALSACYSPNPDTPRGFDFPIDLETGAMREDVWARWRAHDPIVLLEQRVEALRSLSLLYLDCGQRDEFFLNVGMRLFHRRLEQLGIDHAYTEHEGGHFNLHYRLAFLLEAISRAAA
ncbi:MAG TPA: alpha/beta hydrolase-fold protein [Anaerolineales bacterium]|nr:alpha/beta hydrolase-fold protein [Anaerolineales bacterium]